MTTFTYLLVIICCHTLLPIFSVCGEATCPDTYELAGTDTCFNISNDALKYEDAKKKCDEKKATLPESEQIPSIRTTLCNHTDGNHGKVKRDNKPAANGDIRTCNETWAWLQPEDQGKLKPNCSFVTFNKTETTTHKGQPCDKESPKSAKLICVVPTISKPNGFALWIIVLIVMFAVGTLLILLVLAFRYTKKSARYNLKFRLG